MKKKKILIFWFKFKLLCMWVKIFEYTVRHQREACLSIKMMSRWRHKLFTFINIRLTRYNYSTDTATWDIAKYSRGDSNYKVVTFGNSSQRVSNLLFYRKYEGKTEPEFYNTRCAKNFKSISFTSKLINICSCNTLDFSF